MEGAFMLFGEALQQIRKDKNMSQRELSEGILSRSHLSQIENNIYFPSYDKMFQFLDRLNISFEEFTFIKEEYTEDSIQQIKMDINEAANLNETDKLDELARRANRAYKKTNLLTYYHYEMICKALICYQKNSTVTEELTQYILPVKTYLLNNDNWYLYELSIFNSIIFSLDTEEALVFSQRAIKRLYIFRSFTQYQYIEQHIYLNLSNLCMEHHDFKNAQFFSKKAICASQKYTSIFEKICAEIYHAIASIKLGSTDYQVLETNMSMLHYLNFNNLYTLFSTKLEDLGIRFNNHQNIPVTF